MNALSLTSLETRMTQNTPPEAPKRPAWKEPLVWLVVGLPASVVVAGVITVVIAVRGADPVLPTTPAAQQADRALTPAMKARNAAATEAARAAAADAERQGK